MDLIKSGSYIDIVYAKTCATTKISTVAGYHVVLATLLFHAAVHLIITLALMHYILHVAVSKDAIYYGRECNYLYMPNTVAEKCTCISVNVFP